MKFQLIPDACGIIVSELKIDDPDLPMSKSMVVECINFRKPYLELWESKSDP
jgi:hypothetical protein